MHNLARVFDGYDLYFPVLELWLAQL